MSQPMELSFEAMAILGAATFDADGRLRLHGDFPPPEIYREVNRALAALGWRWDRTTKTYAPRPDPRTALAEALQTGEVPL